MRALPNMTVVAPGDPVETELATGAVASAGALLPASRKAGERADARVARPTLSIGSAITVREGRDVSIFATGGMLEVAVAAADALAAGRNFRARALVPRSSRSMWTPCTRAATETDVLVTLEEHSIVGGLGGAVAEVVLEAGVRPRVFKRIGLADSHMAAIGDQDYLRASAGLDVQGVTATIRELVRPWRGLRGYASQAGGTSRPMRFAFGPQGPSAVQRDSGNDSSVEDLEKSPVPVAVVGVGARSP